MLLVTRFDCKLVLPSVVLARWHLPLDCYGDSCSDWVQSLGIVTLTLNTAREYWWIALLMSLLVLVKH